jgi:biotin carboxyl carrier protein
MKMQNELSSPEAGKVIQVAAAAGDMVRSGDASVIVE